MKNKILVCLMGESGCGKTTVSRILEQKYGIVPVVSYTTRKQRFVGEPGHKFVSEEEFDKIPESDMAAYTEFDGHRYCTTFSDLDQADLYVIDPNGIRTLIQKMNGRRRIHVVYLYVPEEIRRQRMRMRGDSEDAIEERIRNDRKEFAGAEAIANVIYRPEADENAEQVAYKIAGSFLPYIRCSDED